MKVFVATYITDDDSGCLGVSYTREGITKLILEFDKEHKLTKEEEFETMENTISQEWEYSSENVEYLLEMHDVK